MSLIARGSDSKFVPPPEGMWNAVCVDVVDLGMIKDQWGEKHKCRIVWELSELMEDGRPFLASKQYTVSLHQKATLYKDLKSWRGRDFTTEEIKGFDLEKVLNAPCRIVITHVDVEDRTYGNVTAILKSDKIKLQPSGTYIRVKDRADYKKPVEEDIAEENMESDFGQEPLDNSDIPF
jgi:hypothetical protein